MELDSFFPPRTVGHLPCLALTVMQVHNPQTQVFVAPGEAHVQCVLDKVMKFGPSKSQVDIAKWVDERLVTIK